jgi:DNA topoisomerase VI subunit A
MKKGYQRKEWLQNFFWNLHNQVNKQNNKEEFLRENLEIYNNKEEFQIAWEIFKKMLTLGIEKKQLKADLVKHAIKFLETLKRLYAL